jgi:hypothetical protein
MLDADKRDWMRRRSKPFDSIANQYGQNDLFDGSN